MIHSFSWKKERKNNVIFRPYAMNIFSMQIVILRIFFRLFIASKILQFFLFLTKKNWIWCWWTRFNLSVDDSVVELYLFLLEVTDFLLIVRKTINLQNRKGSLKSNFQYFKIFLWNNNFSLFVTRIPRLYVNWKKICAICIMVFNC